MKPGTRNGPNLPSVPAKNNENLGAGPQKIKVVEKYTFSKFENIFKRLLNSFPCLVSSFQGGNANYTLVVDFKKRLLQIKNCALLTKKGGSRSLCFFFCSKTIYSNCISREP